MTPWEAVVGGVCTLAVLALGLGLVVAYWQSQPAGPGGARAAAAKAQRKIRRANRQTREQMLRMAMDRHNAAAYPPAGRATAGRARVRPVRPGHGDYIDGEWHA
jgi:hypothetical protein